MKDIKPNISFKKTFGMAEWDENIYLQILLLFFGAVVKSLAGQDYI